MSIPHPTIQYFASTHEESFPLILAIGREPNTDRSIANTIGPYDFRLAPNCGFWNTSYGMLGRIIGLTTKRMKRVCIERDASPLIYADGLPHGVLSAVSNKTEIRGAISPAAVAEHASRIFSHHVLVNRVRVTILSGLDDTNLRLAAAEFRKLCAERSIAVIDLPFFYGTNMPRIELALSNADRELLHAIWREFETSTIRRPGPAGLA